MFRNSDVRMSVITNAFSRLWLQPSISSIVCQQPTQLRTIAQTRPYLLKKQTSVHPSTIALSQGHGHNRNNYNDQSSSICPKTNTSTYPQIAVLPSPPQTSTTGRKTIRTQRKFQPCSRIWTDEVDAKLLRLVKEGRSVYDIYNDCLSYRSLHAVKFRVSDAARVERIRQHQAEGRYRPSDDEDSFVAVKVIAKMGLDVPLRRLYRPRSSRRRGLRNGMGTRATA